MISAYPPKKCGVGDYTFDLCNYLRERDIFLDVLTYKTNNAPSIETVFENLNIYRLLDDNITGWRLWKKIRELSPDIIHLQSTSFLHGRLFNTFVFFKDDTPLITTVHDAPKTFRQLHVIPFLRPIYKRSEKLIIHSDEIKHRLVNFHKIDPEKIVKIHHGVDIEKFRPGVPTEEFKDKYNLKDSFVILFFGFLLPGKGVEDLIDAYKIVSKKMPKTKLVVAGGIPDDTKRYVFGLKSEKSYEKMLKKMVRKGGIEKDVVFTGYIPEDEVPSSLASSDIAVFPYHGASQSGPISKALALGCAIIATRVGGITEIIEDGKNGILIPQKNPQALADAISGLYHNKNLRMLIGKNAREKAEKELSWNEIAKKTLRIYNRMK